MRIRSATTSGAPGVEKARNNVRQKASGKHEEETSMVVCFFSLVLSIILLLAEV